jgi:hypothetical protein
MTLYRTNSMASEVYAEQFTDENLLAAEAWVIRQGYVANIHVSASDGRWYGRAYMQWRDEEGETVDEGVMFYRNAWAVLMPSGQIVMMDDEDFRELFKPVVEFDPSTTSTRERLVAAALATLSPHALTLNSLGWLSSEVKRAEIEVAMESVTVESIGALLENLSARIETGKSLSAGDLIEALDDHEDQAKQGVEP